MKAVAQVGYGSADVLEFKEIDKPVAGEGDVLVRVHAASLGAGDYFGMRGMPFPIRMYIGFPKPKKDYVVGVNLAGRVEAVGKNVTHFKPGDDVFGECSRACAEYTCADEDTLVHKPHNVTFEQAAAMPTSALAALHALRDHGKVQPGQRVLINGASGGVGTFAVQIAKVLGADVTGVCSTGNVDMVRSIGADHVIDYTKDDFTQGEPRAPVRGLTCCHHQTGHLNSPPRRSPVRQQARPPHSRHCRLAVLVVPSRCTLGSRRANCGVPARRSSPRPCRQVRRGSRPQRRVNGG